MREAITCRNNCQLLILLHQLLASRLPLLKLNLWLYHVSKWHYFARWIVILCSFCFSLMNLHMDAVKDLEF